MYKEEIQEQIKRCNELQSECKVEDIDAFIRLSNRIEELSTELNNFHEDSDEDISKEEHEEEPKFIFTSFDKLPP